MTSRSQVQHRQITILNSERTNSETGTDRLLYEALRNQGADIELRAWQDFDLKAATGLVVFRMLWDYVDHYPKFLEWLQQAKSSKAQFVNPLSTIEWNLRKTYLQDLFQKGVTIPKSFFWEGKYLPHWEAFEKTLGPAPYVFKPIVSANARGTFLVQGDVSYSAAIDRMKKEPFIAQEYIRNIKHGEVSALVFGGVFSHAVKKVPQSGDFRVQSDFGGKVLPTKLSPPEIKWVESVVEKAPGAPKIARVDYVPHENGLLLMELEVFEPELFLETDPGSALRLARALIEG
jgi:glutathione synthase/RimK-type ligase-like ATP-grasp enzyme